MSQVLPRAAEHTRSAEPIALDEAFCTFMWRFRCETGPEMPMIPIEVVAGDDAYVVTAMIPGVTVL